MFISYWHFILFIISLIFLRFIEALLHCSIKTIMHIIINKTHKAYYIRIFILIVNIGNHIGAREPR